MPVQQVEAYQWLYENNPYILIPFGAQKQLINFLTDTGVQISIITQ